jgi:hypothetical protein
MIESRGVQHVMRVLICTILIMSMPATGWADDPKDRLCGTWAINAWGLSYHVRQNADYDNANLGAGLRCYARPNWPLFGNRRDNRLLLQFDALRNSHKGLILPASAGAEFKFASFRERCGLYAVGALVFAYYDNRDRKTDYVKWGPVPGVEAGCGRLRADVIFVPSHSSQVIAVITAALTIVFN